MKKSAFILPLYLCLSLSSSGEDPKEATEELKEGHSHQGHAFNEGPRQAGPLMGNTGDVHFPITTTWDKGQAYFNQGIGQLHGFWYYEAERSFRQLLAQDPDCLMAYWGLAMANYENPKRAKEFLAKVEGKVDEANIQEKEKAHLRAIIRFHDDEKTKDQKQRAKNFLTDLENIILDDPDDLEAKAFYVCSSWQFSRKGVPITSHIGLDALLEQIFEADPDHPAHHYAIHLWDYRRHEEALDSAAKLGNAAPGIAHMWHMPGHIYSKAKRYHDASWQQQASARIDHAHMQNHLLLPDQIHNYAHNNEWTSRNFAHLGKVSAAIEMAKSLLANPRHPKLNSPSKGSSRYGRMRLLDYLERFELWGQALALSETHWLEPLEKTSDDAPRLRLMGVAHFHLGNQAGLENIIAKFDGFLAEAKKKQDEAGETAREKATKEEKKEKEIKTAEKKARDQHKKKIAAHERRLAELKGYLATMTDDRETALAAIEKIPSADAKMMRHLALEDMEKAAELANKQIEKNNREMGPLAKAIHVLYSVDPQDPTCRKGFEQLRETSSEIEIESPVFARLAPIAEALGYPADWRLDHKPADDLLPRPKLDELGPLHWTPPAAHDFSLPDQNHVPVSLSDYRGKPVILVFYLGAGCLHCIEQLTAMADRYQEFEKAGLPILAISTDDVTKLRDSQTNYADGDPNKTIPFPLVSDSAKEIFKKYTAHDDFEDQPLHGTFVLDGKGRMLWGDISADPFMDLDFLIKESKRLLFLHQ